MSKGNRIQPAGARRRIQAVTVTGTPPTGLPLCIGMTFAEGVQAPSDMQQVSSATYSLGSPLRSGLQRAGVLSYSLGSPGIPTSLKRLAIFPDNG